MKTSMGVVGVGAFGELAVKHLAPHFDLVLCDPDKDLNRVVHEHGGRVGSLRDAASCEIVLLAVPVQRLRQILTDIEPIVKPNVTVIDVASVKVKPVEMMREILPASVQIVGTHPLFGPQSSQNGISGLNIAVCTVRGTAADAVRHFCREQLCLRVLDVTPEEHDRELAYVQGLTHLMSKIIVELDLPAFRCTTKTYHLMQQMVETVRYDSDELFRAIELENPYAPEAKERFFAAVRSIEKKLSGGAPILGR